MPQNSIPAERTKHGHLREIVSVLGLLIVIVLGAGMWLRFRPGKLCNPTPGAQPDLWSLAAPMPTARSETAASGDEGKIYVSGGIGLRGSLDSFEVYDTLRDRWTVLSPLPTPLHHHGLVVSGGLIYVAGGYVDLSMTPTAAVWVYNPKTNAWRSIAPLPAARGALVLVEFDGAPVAVGGVGRFSRTLWRYNREANGWQTLGRPLPLAREHHAAVALRDTLYVMGGRWENRNLNSVHAYDLVKSAWVELSPMPTARSGIGAVVVDGRVHVFGGEDLGRGCVFSTHEAYDPGTDSWKVGPAAPRPRHGLGVVAMDDRLFLIGGAIRPGWLTPLAATSKVDVLEGVSGKR